MTDQEYEMPFETAKTVVQEIIRQNRGLGKLEDVLKAATRAESFARTMGGKIKEAEGKKSALDALLVDLAKKVQKSKTDLKTQTELAKRTYGTLVKGIAQNEREARKRYADLESSLKADYESKKAAVDEALAQIKEQLASLNRERKAVQTQLDTLTGNLQSVMEKFSATA